MKPQTILLGAYPAKQCARRTHNNFDPTAPQAEAYDPQVQRRLDEGNSFEAQVVAYLVATTHKRQIVVIEYGDHVADKDRRIHETAEALRSGVRIIVGAQLPDDRLNGRVGCPDVLIRADVAGSVARYLPVDVKNHQSLATGKAPSTMATVSSIALPQARVPFPGISEKSPNRRKDAFQLAHYTRMLQTHGVHPGSGHLVGGIIGSTDFEPINGEPFGITWIDLDAPTEATYSARLGANATRSFLANYDEEFARRLLIANVATQQGHQGAALSLVQPLGKDECFECPWNRHCKATVMADDASFAIIKGRLNDPEWTYLYELGGSTITGLADLEPTGALLEGFLAHAGGSHAPEQRLVNVIRRARMLRDDVVLERTAPVALTVPSADLEVDFDIEWDAAGHVYLWGARVRRGADDTTSTYWVAADFDPMTAASAQALAERFFDWLKALVAKTEAAGRSVLIFHWAPPERTAARKYLLDIDTLLEGRCVDLLTFMREHYFDREGMSIKQIAPVFGFAWRAKEAGGEASMDKIVAARAGDASAAEWLLSYNGDDCSAMTAIRDGLRTVAEKQQVPAPRFRPSDSPVAQPPVQHITDETAEETETADPDGPPAEVVAVLGWAPPVLQAYVTSLQDEVASLRAEVLILRESTGRHRGATQDQPDQGAS